MKMQGIRPNLQSLTSVLKLCAKSFDLETALKVVEETQNCGPQPDIYFWNSFLNVCIKCNQLRRIFETWRVLLASDSAARPDTSTFNTALEACGRLGDVQELVAVLQEGLQEKVQLNRYSFSAMVNGCIDAGHSATAVKWFLELEAAFPWSLVLLSSLFRVIQRGSKLLEPLQPEEKRRCAEQFERYRLDAEGLTDGSKKGLIRKEYKAVLLHTFEKARKMGMFAENVRLEEESLLSLVGLPGPVAEVALTHSLALVQRIFARSEKVGRLEIVTGKGRIKQCCLNFMRSKNLEYSQHPKNAGRFIVSEANLKKFLLHIKKWPGYVL